jgi:hypothetical protein
VALSDLNRDMRRWAENGSRFMYLDKGQDASG